MLCEKLNIPDVISSFALHIKRVNIMNFMVQKLVYNKFKVYGIMLLSFKIIICFYSVESNFT